MESESAQPQKCSCKCHKHAVIIFVVLLIAGVACWYIHHPNRPRSIEPGQYCQVWLRESTTVFEGTVVADSREAILLEGRTTSNPEIFSFWIPKCNILYIRIENPESRPIKRVIAPRRELRQKDQTETGE